MDRQTGSVLQGYDRWATENVFTATESLAIETLNPRTGKGYGSIFDTLAHLVAADVVWMSRLNGFSPTALLQSSDFASLEEIRHRWLTLQDDWALFMDRLPEGGLDTNVSYSNTRGLSFTRPVWHIVLHMVNHSTHHRSELSEMLTIQGKPHIALDMHTYLAKLGQVT